MKNLHMISVSCIGKVDKGRHSVETNHMLVRYIYLSFFEPPELLTIPAHHYILFGIQIDLKLRSIDLG